MQKMGAGLLVGCVLAACFMGCNTLARQPQFKDTAIAPADLKPNDTGAVTVRLVDRHKIVRRVEGVIREEPKIKLRFRDDGVGEDKQAGDGTWTYPFAVRITTPPGEYHLDITAYRSDGQPVSVKRADKTKGPLTTSLPIVIKAP